MMIRKRGRLSTSDGVRWSLLISLSALGVPCVAAERAEYAIRWEAAAGVPSTEDDVAKLLADKAADHNDYEVQYFRVGTLPKDAPKEATAILRQRERKGKTKYELTFKYRSATPFADPTCPLDESTESKSEVDVSAST